MVKWPDTKPILSIINPKSNKYLQMLWSGGKPFEVLILILKKYKKTYELK